VGNLQDLKKLTQNINLQKTTLKNDIENEQDKKLPKIDNLGRSYATGKRKNSISRVWIKKGTGKYIINNIDYNNYFKRIALRMIINQPFITSNKEGVFDVFCTVSGGGLSGQAMAIRHGISKALSFFDPELRAILKPNGLLTRDSRVVERKKYGKPKARKSFQFSKR